MQILSGKIRFLPKQKVVDFLFTNRKLVKIGGWLNWHGEEGANCLVSGVWVGPLLAPGWGLEEDEVSVWPPPSTPIPHIHFYLFFSVANPYVNGAKKWKSIVFTPPMVFLTETKHNFFGNKTTNGWNKFYTWFYSKKKLFFDTGLFSPGFGPIELLSKLS